MIVSPNQVWCSRSPVAGYASCAAVGRATAPELPGGYAATTAELTLRNLFHSSKLDAARYGTRHWNPLGVMIEPGSRVVLKPNWVRHAPMKCGNLDCLVTHASVIEAVLKYVAKTRPSSVIIGDAPLQDCDFDKLQSACGMDTVVERLANQLPNLSVRDFRRTTLAGPTIGSERHYSSRGDDDFVLFDLGSVSELEAVSTDADKFRVTMYDPDALKRTHSQGKHQYLVAREIIDSDVVINLPKLKTHKKACITGALKNFVGVNGLKDYLPHHRIGGSRDGGDCYEGRSWLKRLAEHTLDAANRTQSLSAARVQAKLARAAAVAGRLCGHDANLEGSWYGNDTIWRTTLDLQRIVHYGGADGRLASAPQRKVLTITDAIIAGEGEGPLSPQPVPLGLLTFALSTVAAEWAHALLMGFDPSRISLTREAFQPHAFPLAGFRPDDVEVTLGQQRIRLADLPAVYGRTFLAPAGWRGFCERNRSDEAVRCSA